MPRRRNGTLTTATERTWKCCLFDDGAHGVWSGRAGSRQRSSQRPPPRSMAVVRVPEFPGWLLLPVSIVSGTRRMFVCCCFARWPLPVRPGPLIRPGPSPSRGETFCLSRGLPSTQTLNPRHQPGGRPDQTRCGKWSNCTTRHGEMETWISSSTRAARASCGVVAHAMCPCRARRDISHRHVKMCGLEVEVAEGRLQVIKSCTSPDWHAHLC